MEIYGVTKRTSHLEYSEEERDSNISHRKEEEKLLTNQYPYLVNKATKQPLQGINMEKIHSLQTGRLQFWPLTRQWQ